ncbi:MAG: hypothetical protein SF029_12260 [bacterium]|nr:hypothetical protein [bacterium]
MTDRWQVLGHLLYGSIILFSGFRIWHRKTARIGIGRGRTEGIPFLSIEITGTGAVLFGMFSAIAGTTMIIPIILVLLRSDVPQVVLVFCQLASMAIWFFGLCFSLIIQSAKSLGESLKINRETGSKAKIHPLLLNNDNPQDV